MFYSAQLPITSDILVNQIYLNDNFGQMAEPTGVQSGRQWEDWLQHGKHTHHWIMLPQKYIYLDRLNSF